MTFVLWGSALELCPFFEIVKSVQRKFLQQLSLYVFAFESQIKLLENSYIDGSIVCIVRKKVDDEHSICKPPVWYNHRYFSCKEVFILKVSLYSHNYIQHGPYFWLPMGPWAPSFQKLGRTLLYIVLIMFIEFCNSRHILGNVLMTQF